MYYLCIKFHGFWIDWGNGELVTEGVADSFCAIVTIYVSTIYLGIRKPIRRVNYVKIINFFFSLSFYCTVQVIFGVEERILFDTKSTKIGSFLGTKRTENGIRDLVPT